MTTAGLVMEIAAQSFSLEPQGPLEYRVSPLAMSITAVADIWRRQRTFWLRIGASDRLEVQRFVAAKPCVAELASYAGRKRRPQLGVTWPVTIGHAALTLGITPAELMDI